jgi:quercetin dioxygenase-like cupin family protein
MGCSPSKPKVDTPTSPSAAVKASKEGDVAAAVKGGTGKGCVEENPDCYKEICKNDLGRLVLMDIPAGHTDKPHDHPKHYCYVLKGGKLEITGPDGKPNAVEMPTGAAPIIPAGPHQVKNTGEENFQILFWEITGKEGPTPQNHVSPCECDKEHYTILAEDDDWFIGMLTMKAGETDVPHSHRDHTIYFLEGGNLTIKDWGLTNDKSNEHVMNKEIPAGAGMPMPPTHHQLTVNGDKDIQVVFFEAKKPAEA